MTTLCTPFSTQHYPDPNAPSGAKVLLWKIISKTIFPHLPSPLYKIRRIIIRSFGDNLDPHARIRGGVHISHPWNLTIGRKSSIGEGTQVFNPAPLTIGDRSVISQYCYVSCVSCVASVANDQSDPIKPQHPSPLTIGDDVWVATECIIQGNQTIPNGLLAGARSTLLPSQTSTTQLTPWTIATGHPAISRRERPYQGQKS